jgi:predicted transcriptional regulator
MYKTNMNYSQLQSNLIFLSLRGLLDCEMDKYVTAEKGYRFLELFTEMQSILNDEVV